MVFPVNNFSNDNQALYTHLLSIESEKSSELAPDPQPKQFLQSVQSKPSEPSKPFTDSPSSPYEKLCLKVKESVSSSECLPFPMEC